MPSLPEKLIRSLNSLEHFDEKAFSEIHQSGEQVISLHLNPGKSMSDEFRQETSENVPFQTSGSVPWADNAFYLSSRPSFTLDPFFHAGTYYVQEASGMFLAHALKTSVNLSEKIKVLDLCAAPGGKSTLIQSLISSDSLLVSNEVIKSRVPVLYQNITKWGGSNGIVSNNDPIHFKKLTGFFDVVVIDAPCSGSGLFRKDPAAISHWSEDLVNLCSQRQQRIVADAWDCLKSNGTLIYCTCSFSPEENEQVIDGILMNYDCETVPLFPDKTWNIIESVTKAGGIGYRFYPDKLSGEGFFISVIKKKEQDYSGETDLFVKLRRKIHPVRHGKSEENILNHWVKDGSYHFITIGDTSFVIPSGLSEDFEILKTALYLKKAGVRIGRPTDKEWIPDHELAMSFLVNESLPSLEISKSAALQFLRGEPFETADTGRGWRLVNYGKQHLGWVKLVDKRMNNYYPKSWRIRL